MSAPTLTLLKINPIMDMDGVSSVLNVHEWLQRCWSAMSLPPEQWEVVWSAAAAEKLLSVECSKPPRGESTTTRDDFIPLLHAFLSSGAGEATVIHRFPPSSNPTDSCSGSDTGSRVPSMESFSEIDDWLAAIDEEADETSLRPALQALRQNLPPMLHRCILIVQWLLHQGFDPLRPLTAAALPQLQTLPDIAKRGGYASGGYYTPTARIVNSSPVDPPTPASLRSGINAIEIAVEQAFFPALLVLLEHSAIPSISPSSNPSFTSLTSLLPRSLLRFRPSTVLEFLHEKDARGDNSSGKIDNLTPLPEQQRLQALHAWTQMPFDMVSFNSNCIFQPLSPSDLLANVGDLLFSSSPTNPPPWIQLSRSQRSFLQLCESPMGVFSATLLAYWTACTVSELVWRGADVELKLPSSDNNQPTLDSFLTHLQLEMLPSLGANSVRVLADSDLQLLAEAKEHIARELCKEDARVRDRVAANGPSPPAPRKYISPSHRRLLTYLRIQRSLFKHARYVSPDSSDDAIVEPLPAAIAIHFSAHPFAPQIAGVLHGLRRRDLRTRWLELIFTPCKGSTGIAADIVRNHVAKFL